MNKKQVSALLVLRELGIDHRMESFDDRLSVQKSIYLAQAVGADLGHYFSWYLRGPYSASLTQDVFESLQSTDVSAALHGWELDEGTKVKLAPLQLIFAPPVDLQSPAWLELLASVHFLIDRKQVATSETEVLRTQLAKYNKNFTSEQVAEAVTRLRGVRLIPSA